jgi:hypothetical protein
LQRQLETKAAESQDDRGNVISGGSIDTKRQPKTKPDTQALLVQLLELRTGLETTERSTALQRTAPIVDQKKMKEREDTSKALLSELGSKREPPVLTQGNGQDPPSESQVDHDDLESVSEVDKRLDALEKRIGASIDHASSVSKI